LEATRILPDKQENVLAEYISCPHSIGRWRRTAEIRFLTDSDGLRETEAVVMAESTGGPGLPL